jgi:transcriptional regulator with XRE-family HTH domain
MRPEKRPLTELGTRLRSLRKSRGLTLVQLAEIVGMPISSVGDIETGVRKTIRVSTARRIAERLGVKVTDIIGGE